MFPKAVQLNIEVVKIKGQCPTYKPGDSFQIQDGYKLVSTIPVCLHALQGLMPYYIPLSYGMSPYDLGLSSKETDQETNEAFFQCQDPQEITGGGCVVFKVRVIR